MDEAKNKEEADRRFKLYMRAVDRQAKYAWNTLIARLCAILRINRKENLEKAEFYDDMYGIMKQIVRDRAIAYEEVSENKLPEITRRHLKLP